MEAVVKWDIYDTMNATPQIKRAWYAVRRRLLAIVAVPYHISRVKWFIQRGRRGYADCDYWSMNDYLISVILPLLKLLKENQHGYPGHGQASTPEKWDILLDKMITGFEAGNRICEDEYYMATNSDILERKPEPEEVQQWINMANEDRKIFHGSMKIFNKWFFALWD